MENKFQKMYKAERKEHPSFTKTQVARIVYDHMRKKK